MTDKKKHKKQQPEETVEESVEATGDQAPPTDEDPMAALQAERDELYARLQRVSADYQNYIRRSQTESARSVDLARGDIAKNFIPVLDHFDNALSKEPETDEAKALYAGVKIVCDELLRVLNQLGVERIEVEVGDPFDPAIHEAMLRQPAEGVKPNHVSMFMQPGYRHGDRTLRPAKVAVAPEE